MTLPTSTNPYSISKLPDFKHHIGCSQSYRDSREAHMHKRIQHIPGTNIARLFRGLTMSDMQLIRHLRLRQGAPRRKGAIINLPHDGTDPKQRKTMGRGLSTRTHSPKIFFR